MVSLELIFIASESEDLFSDIFLEETGVDIDTWLENAEMVSWDNMEKELWTDGSYFLERTAYRPDFVFYKLKLSSIEKDSL